MLSCFKAQRLVICFFVLVVSVGESVAADLDYASLIDTSGSQRMLSQRMLRDYVLIGMGVKYQDPIKDLSDTVSRFDKQLHYLLQQDVNADVSQALHHVEEVWKNNKVMLAENPDKKTAVILAAAQDDLLKGSNDAVALIQKASGEKLSKVVNISGRQRMLSQRMAALYLLVLWDIPDSNFYEEFRDVVSEYRKAHNYLLTSDQTTPVIKGDLNNAAKLFRWFSKVAAKKSTRLTPEVIQRNSDGLLKIMQKVTSMYVAG